MRSGISGPCLSSTVVAQVNTDRCYSLVQQHSSHVITYSILQDGDDKCMQQVRELLGNSDGQGLHSVSVDLASLQRVVWHREWRHMVSRRRSKTQLRVSGDERQKRASDISALELRVQSEACHADARSPILSKAGNDQNCKMEV